MLIEGDNQTDYVRYQGDGSEHGEIAKTVIGEFRSRIPIVGEGPDDVHPTNIFYDEGDHSMMFESSTCTTLKSSGYYTGHRIYLDIGKSELRCNYSGGIIKITSPQEARQELVKMIEGYKTANWRDLIPRVRQPNFIG